MLFLPNESHHILQHKKVGVFQWDRMFETRNEPRHMIVIQKSLGESRPLLELREGVKEPVLRGEGEEAGSQRGWGRAYSPYQGRSHHKHGGGEGSHLQTQGSSYCEVGCPDHRAARLFLSHPDADCGGQTMGSLIAEINRSSFSFIQTDSLGLACSLWSVWICWKIKKPLHFRENFQKALSAKWYKAGNLSWAPWSPPLLVPPLLQRSPLKTLLISPSDRTNINLESYFAFFLKNQNLNVLKEIIFLMVRVQLSLICRKISW